MGSVTGAPDRAYFILHGSSKPTFGKASENLHQPFSLLTKRIAYSCLSKLLTFENYIILSPICQDYSLRSSPQKNSATVPGPVWLPMVVPILFITTLPLSFGKLSSTSDATA